MNSSEAAEQIVKISLEGLEVAARITGRGAERVASLLFAMAKEKRMTKGKTKLNNMLKSGSQLKIFSIRQDELAIFHEKAKQYGVLYSALLDKKHPSNDGYVDIMVRNEDAPKVNRIVEKFNLSSVDIASVKSEIEKDRIEEMIKEAKEKGLEIKSDEEKLADDIMTKPDKNIEVEKQENPNLGKTEKSPLSEPSLGNKNKSEEVSKDKKPSVREKLKQIIDKMKQEEVKDNSKEKSMGDEKKIKNKRILKKQNKGKER